MSWRALGRPGDSSLSVLFGGVFVHARKAYCFASEGPVVRIPTPANRPSDYVVFRQELTPEERRHCADDIRNGLAFGPQAGAVLDVPVGERLFFRAGVRLWLQCGSRNRGEVLAARALNAPALVSAGFRVDVEQASAAPPLPYPSENHAFRCPSPTRSARQAGAAEDHEPGRRPRNPTPSAAMDLRLHLTR